VLRDDYCFRRLTLWIGRNSEKYMIFAKQTTEDIACPHVPEIILYILNEKISDHKF